MYNTGETSSNGITWWTLELQMANLDLNMLSAVRIKQIGILFEDLVHVSMLPSVLIGRHIRE